MVNSMELLLGKVSKISTPATITNNTIDMSDNSFNSELQNELDGLLGHGGKNSEKLNLLIEFNEVETEIVEDENSNTSEVSEIIITDQMMIIQANNEQLNNALTQDINPIEQGNNSSPDFVDTMTSLGEFVVLEANPKQNDKPEKLSENGLTESVKADSDNVFLEKNMQDLIFKTKLQKLYESSLGKKNHLDNTIQKAEKDNMALLEMPIKNLSVKQLSQKKNIDLNPSKLPDKLIEFKQDSINKIEGVKLNNISSISEIKTMLNFDSETAIEHQLTEFNTNAEINSENIMNQMTKSITYGKLADGEFVNVKLKPDYLGEMSFNIQKNASGSILNIKVENETVKRMLSEKIDELLTVLSDKFITIDKVMVTTEIQDNNNGSHFSQQLSQHQQEFGNSQSNDSQRNHNGKEYMTLDAVTSNQDSKLETLYGLEGKRVSIYV